MKSDSLIRSFHMMCCTYWCAARKARVKWTVIRGMEVNRVSIRGGISVSSSSAFSISSFVLDVFEGREFGSMLDICPVDESSRNCVSVALRSINCPFGICGLLLFFFFFFFPSLLMCWFSSCCRSAAISRRVLACRVLLFLLLLFVNSGGRERGIEESTKLFSFSAAAAAAARRCLRL